MLEPTDITNPQILRLIEASQQAGGSDKTIVPEEPEVKFVYSFKELWANRNQKPEFIIPNLIPKNAVCILMGEDGIGKTQILTQLCLAMSLKLPTFLNLPLSHYTGNTMVIATEESKERFSSAAIKQLTYYQPFIEEDSLPNLKFMEGADFDDWEQMLSTINKELKEEPKDLIVIDALSDLFTYIDGEINNNRDARKILSKLQSVCKNHDTTIIVIHHAAKTKVVEMHKLGKLLLEKNSSQGAGAISQKPRTILALSNKKGSETEEGHTNYLHVVKANVMDKTYMNNILECKFLKNDLVHVFDSFKTPAEIDDPNNPELAYEKTESGQMSLKDPFEISIITHAFKCQEIMISAGKNINSREQLIPFVMEAYNISNRAAKNDYIPYFNKHKILIKNEHGLYEYNPTFNQETLPIEDAVTPVTPPCLTPETRPEITITPNTSFDNEEPPF